METTAAAVLSRTAECAALLAIGYQLRASRLFSATDAEAAQRLAGYLTLPAVVLQSCNTLPPVSWPALLGGPLVLASSAAAAAVTWFLFSKSHKRERAVLAGCAVGSDAPAVAVPVIEALAGPAGVVAACSALLANALSVYVGSYLLSASAGPAFPDSYQHEDGGTYRGEWRGMSKEGLGVYTYASGARYEGEWRDNVKAGRGVYYYPKGGTYEGEWSSGVLSGTGLRTYATGRVAAGRWEGGRLVAPLELWQCANAAEGAAEAALAARRVVVGGGKPLDAAGLLVLQPVLWAAAVGLALNALAMPLPGSLAAVAAALAPANKPLMLLSAGMLLQPVMPQSRQVRDVTAVLAARVACALCITSIALALLPLLPPAAAAAAASSSSIGLLSVLSAALILLSPLPPAILEFTRNFRLNEGLAGACRDASAAAAVPSLLLLVGAVGGLGLLPVMLPLPQTVVVDWTPAAADPGAPTLLASGLLLLAAAVAAAAGVVWDKLDPSKGKVLKYAGSDSSSSRDPTAAAAAAAAAAAGLTGPSGAEASSSSAAADPSSSSSSGQPGTGSEPPSSSSSGSSSTAPSALRHQGSTAAADSAAGLHTHMGRHSWLQWNQPGLGLGHCRVLQHGCGVLVHQGRSSRGVSSVRVAAVSSRMEEGAVTQHQQQQEQLRWVSGSQPRQLPGGLGQHQQQQIVQPCRVVAQHTPTSRSSSSSSMECHSSGSRGVTLQQHRQQQRQRLQQHHGVVISRRRVGACGLVQQTSTQRLLAVRAL